MYHICCMPEGPAKAHAPTMTGNQAAVMASCGKYPKWNMPVIVLTTSSQVPTMAATTAVPSTSVPIRIDSTFSSRL
nr:hypothetical protein GCM10020093_106970 [Planobispora longispora]